MIFSIEDGFIGTLPNCNSRMICVVLQLLTATDQQCFFEKALHLSVKYEYTYSAYSSYSRKLKAGFIIHHKYPNI